MAGEKFGKSLLIAVCAAFGNAIGMHTKTKTWIDVRVRLYEELGDKYLLTFKTLLTRVYRADAESSGIRDKMLRGQVLPPDVISVKGRKLYQYCKVRRALPLPTKETLRAKGEEYIAKATAPLQSRPVPKTVRDKIQRTCARIKRKPFKPASGDIVSSSGCLEFSRKQGGRSRVLDGAVKFTFTADSWYRSLKHGELPRPTIERNIQSRVDTFFAEVKLPEKVDMQVSMVAELGCKVRGVTKSPARIVAESNRYRRTYFPVLTNDKYVVTSEALMDPELSHIHFDGLNPEEEYFVYSADLTDATTSLSHESLALVCEGTGIPDKLVYQDHYIGGNRVNTGTPMGLSCGWFCLTIIHNCICEIIDPKHNYRLKGDDLIAFWTQKQIDRYIELSASVGLIVNDKTVKSLSYGTFCEGDYDLLRHGSGHQATLRRAPTFSIRSFVRDEPLSFEQGSVFVARGVPLELLCNLQRIAHKQWFILAAEHGVPAYAPVQFGGLGMLCPENRHVDRLTAKAVQAVNNFGTVLQSSTVQKFVPKTIVNDVFSTIASIRYTVPEAHADGYTLGNELSNRIDQCSTKYAAMAAFTDAVQIGASPVKKDLTPPQRVKALKQYRKRQYRGLHRSTSVPTTVGMAYSVLARARPVASDAKRVFRFDPELAPAVADLETREVAAQLTEPN